MSSEKEKPKPKQISLIEKWHMQMNLIQEKTGIKGIFVVIGLVLSVIFVYFNIFDTIITNLVGTLYPAFWTIKSIEKNDLSDQKNWLTYWAVFGSFVLVDMFSPIIVKFVPFYFVFKIMFLIWLFMPGSQGCNIIYNLIVKKIMRRYVEKFEDVMDNVENVVFNKNKQKGGLNKLKKFETFNWDDTQKAAQELEEDENNENKEDSHKKVE